MFKTNIAKANKKTAKVAVKMVNDLNAHSSAHDLAVKANAYTNETSKQTAVDANHVMKAANLNVPTQPI